MLLKLISATLVLLTVSAARVSAQSQPAPKIGGHLEMLGFTLGKSTLADVQAKLGKSTVRRCSREEEASKEICYMAAGKDQTRVVFESGFSGGWKELDGYKVIAGSLQPGPCYRQCPRASQVTSDVQTHGGLKLGLTREQVTALFGPPQKTRGNRLTFQWQSRQAMTQEEKDAASKTFKTPATDAYYDVQDTIEVTLSNSKVVEFSVHHIVTD
jgi:hypothetical protein